MPQYDAIAEQYDRSASDRSDREMVLAPSAQHYLGSLNGMRVLDLACGSGYFTRLIRQLGAAHVVGVDISPEMIELARKHQDENGSAMEYHVGDAAQLGDLGTFDVVFAGFLLHYSSSLEQLTAMCKNISRSLRKGGRFVTFNENAKFPLHEGVKYGVEVIAHGAIQDGTAITRTHYVDGRKDFCIEHYHYEPETYEKVLKSAGFGEIEWKQFVGLESADLNSTVLKEADLKPAGVKSADDYWRDYLNDFSIAVLLARKAGSDAG